MSRNRAGWNALLERALANGRARVVAGDGSLELEAGKRQSNPPPPASPKPPPPPRDMFDLPLSEVEEARFWAITPTPAPRQVRRDAWKPSAAVLRYRAFRDEVAARKVWAPTPGDVLVFLMPIPRSWNQRKRLEHDGMPHLAKPDVDNLAKALLDAVYGNDSHIWAVSAFKLWSSTPGIVIIRRDPMIEIPFRL